MNNSDLQALAIKKRNANRIKIAYVVVALFFIGLFIPKTKDTNTSTAIEAAPLANEKLRATSAYVVAKMYMKNHLGSADFGAFNDGFTDYGDSTVMVSGIADVRGTRYRWTVEMRYNGGTQTDPNNWRYIRYVMQ